MEQEQDRELDRAYAILVHEGVMSPTRMGGGSETATEDLSLSFPPLSPTFSMTSSENDNESVEVGLEGFASPSRESANADGNDENRSPLSPEIMTPPRVVKRKATFHFEDATPRVGDLIARFMNKEDGVKRGVYRIKFLDRTAIGLKLHSMPIAPTRPPADKFDNEEGDNNKSNKKQQRTTKKRQPDAFIVWGFREVDACSSENRPTIGARLVAVDGSSCEQGQWGTLNEMCKRIRDGKGPVTLSFRNEPVTGEQVEHLNRVLPKRAKGGGGGNSATTTPKANRGGPTTVCMMKTPEKSRRQPLGLLRGGGKSNGNHNNAASEKSPTPKSPPFGVRVSSF